MTGEIFLTCIVPAAHRDVMRAIVACFDGPDYFVSPLSATGSMPATHYISSGLVNPLYLTRFTDPVMVYTRSLEENPAFAYTQQQVTDAIAASILHDGTYLGQPEGVFALLARLNLRQVNQ